MANTESTEELACLARELLPASEPLGAASEPLDPAAWKSLSNFVLSSQTAIELGSPKKGGVLMTYVSEDKTCGDEAYLLGKDLQAIPPNNGDLSFAVLIELSGSGLDDELLYMINQNILKYLHVRGSMVKGTDNEIWMRFNRDCIACGMNFAKMAKLFFLRLHENFAEVEGCRLFFINEESALLDKAKRIASKMKNQQEALRRKVWDSRGFNFDECKLLVHCGQCSDKKLCANVRKMERMAFEKRNG